MPHPLACRVRLQAHRDIEWDRAVLLAMQKRRRDAADELRRLSPTVTKIQQQCEQQRQQFPDLSIPAVYEAHCKLFVTIANEIVLAPQRRRFDIDDNNRDILRFLLYYFNECPLAEEVFPTVATNSTKTSCSKAA